MVKYLASYMNQRTPNRRGCSYIVDIQTEVNKYISNNPGKKPVVVFDFLSCLSIMLGEVSEVYFGGRHTTCTGRAIEFCEKFQQLGVEMVFFLDGPIKQNKVPKYLHNSNTKYASQQEIFDIIKNEKTLPTRKPYSIKMSVYSNTFLLIVKKYAKIYISIENECDLDLAEYATRLKALAVVTPDTDFLIFPSDWQIWSPVKFNLTNFRALAWNKCNMRKYLKLRTNQMPIFAALSGNDYFNYEEIQHITEQIKSDQPQQEKLSELIRTTFPKGVPLSKIDMTKIINIICQNDTKSTNKKEVERKLQLSFDFYDYSTRKIPRVENWLVNHIKHTNTVIVYVILKNHPITINQSYIDLQVPDTKPYSKIVVPIVQRQLGICLYDKKHEYVKRTFYFKPSHEEPFQAGIFEPIYPDEAYISMPALTDILYIATLDVDGASSNSSDEIVTLEEKFRLLAWIISPIPEQIISFEKLIEINDSPLLIPAIICYILVQEKQISVHESDVLLLSIHQAINSAPEALKLIKSLEYVKQRPFWISFIFNRLADVMHNTFVICGLYKFSTVSHFDGYIFHKMYLKFLDFHDEKKLELIQPILKYRIYE